MHSVSRDARANWGSLRAVRCQKMHASTLYLDGWTIASPNPQVHAKHSSFWPLVVYLVILVLSCTRVNQLSQGLEWTEPLLRSSLPGPRPFDLANKWANFPLYTELTETSMNNKRTKTSKDKRILCCLWHAPRVSSHVFPKGNNQSWSTCQPWPRLEFKNAALVIGTTREEQSIPIIQVGPGQCGNTPIGSVQALDCSRGWVASARGAS